MQFFSILFKNSVDCLNNETIEAPAFFADLNLDQIIDAITANWQEYNIKPFFYASLKDIDSIIYRQEIMQDLDNINLLENIKEFSEKIRLMREYLAQADKLYYKYQKERMFLDAVEIYCSAVNKLTQDLLDKDLKSRGFLDFKKYMVNYIESDCFRMLLQETEQLEADLAKVNYNIHIKGNCIKVGKYENESDYSAEIMEVFSKFKQEAAEEHKFKFYESLSMNHVEAGILELVAKLYPDTFLSLSNYYVKNINYMDKTVGDFDREIQFYVSYLEYIAVIKQAGLKLCYPFITNTDKNIYDFEGFDLALANKLISQNSHVVCNDFYLKEKERIIVVSGPNQGGKTTFARTFGQLHYLASLGFLVPGREAKLFLFDRIFTHFEKEENLKNLSGKLQDDLIRIHEILNEATPDSILIMNEIFSSTTLKDAIFLGKRVMKRIIELDIICVCVTFIEELACLGEKTVSMLSTVAVENHSQRTYKILRRPADGLSYAISIAEKYRLTYDCLKERIRL